MPGCYRGRNTKLYTVQYPDTDDLWSMEGVGYLDLAVHGRPAKPQWDVADGYMDWYRDHTHPQIHPEEDIPGRVFLPPVGNISETFRLSTYYHPQQVGNIPPAVWSDMYHSILAPAIDHYGFRMDDIGAAAAAAADAGPDADDSYDYASD